MAVDANLRRRVAFLGRALRGDRREKHELVARLRALPETARWRRRNLRAARPAILIGLIEHMGDIIASEPIARHLRQKHPEAVLVWAVRPTYRCLVEHHPAIDAVAEVTCLTQWIVLSRGGGFARVVDLHVPGRSCDDCVARLPPSSHAPGISNTNYYKHGCLLGIACQVAGLPRLDDQTPRLHLPNDARRRVQALPLPARFIVFHGRSNQQARDWDAACWPRLAAQLHDRTGMAVVEVGLRPVLSAAAHVIQLCGKLSLLETAAAIGRSRLFVGIDSGPAHMANALDVPGVILLGKYSGFDRYMPYSGRFRRGEQAHIVHWPAPAREIPVELVQEHAVDLLGASIHVATAS